MTDTDKMIRKNIVAYALELSDAELEARFEQARQQFNYYGAEILRRTMKPITPEEREASLKVCRSIGRKAGVQTWYDESLTGGTKEVV